METNKKQKIKKPSSMKHHGVCNGGNFIAEDCLVQVSSKFPREVPVSVESAIDPPGEVMFSFKNYF